MNSERPAPHDTGQHTLRFTPVLRHELPAENTHGWPDPSASLHPSLINTRAFLCRALDGLAEQREAVTIIGSHAVHERTQQLDDIVSTSTKDGDLALTPQLATDQPSIEALMRRQGFRPLMEVAAQLPDGHPGKGRWQARPGLWGIGIDDAGIPVEEIDLLVPEPLAGGRGRSVKTMPAHGRAKIGRVRGIELAVLERDLMPIKNFQDGTTRLAYVARPSGLLCAKSHKITDRLDDVDRPLRSANIGKDMIDVWRILATAGETEAAGQFERHTNHPTMGPAIREGRARFVRLLQDPTVQERVTQALEALDADTRQVPRVFTRWLAAFS